MPGLFFDALRAPTPQAGGSDSSRMSLSVVTDRSVGKFSRSSVEGGSGHAKISSYLCDWIPVFHEVKGATDLAIGDTAGPAAEGEARLSAFAHNVEHAFSFDFVFHLGEGSHDGEEHGADRSCRIDVAAAEVQDA